MQGNLIVMFGLGFSEIAVILIVALLVFGPERLPEISRTLGKTLAELRRTVDDLKREVTREPDEIRKVNSRSRRPDLPPTPPVENPVNKEEKEPKE